MTNLTPHQQDLINRVASLECKGDCWVSCGPIRVQKAENDRIRRFCEDRGLSFHDLLEARNPPPANRPPCVYLERGRCVVHPARPAICRLYGASLILKCVYGCRPKLEPLDEAETREYIGMSWAGLIP